MIKALQARERNTEYFYRVHIDTTKEIDDPEDKAPEVADPDNPGRRIPDPGFTAKKVPDPAYIREYHWGKDVSEEDREREMKALVALELSRMDPGTALAKEGQEL